MQSDQQLSATGNPQNIGEPNIVNQQSNLQQTANQNAFTSTTDRGVPIKIDSSNLKSEIRRQASPPVSNTNKAGMLWGVSIAGIIIAIVLWYIGDRAQKKNA